MISCPPRFGVKIRPLQPSRRFGLRFRSAAARVTSSEARWLGFPRYSPSVCLVRSCRALYRWGFGFREAFASRAVANGLRGVFILRRIVNDQDGELGMTNQVLGRRS